MSKNRRNIRRKIGKSSLKVNSFFIVIAVLILVIIICLSIGRYKQHISKLQLAREKEELEKYSQEIFSEIEETISKTNKEISETDEIIKISAVGDILCGESMIEDAYNETFKTYDFSHMFNKVKQYTNKSDIVMGTMETNFTKGKYTSQNTPKEFAKAVKEAGVNLVTICHNHSLDYGVSGLKNTKEYLQSIGYGVIGDKIDGENNAISIKKVKDTNIAFLTYTYGVNNQYSKTKKELSTVSIYSEKQVKEDIEYAKENGAEYIVVMIHWGDVMNHKVSTEQEKMADFLVESGADIIIGAHPSVVQPMEVRENKEGKNVFIAYSIGTYISSLADEDSKTELVLNIELRKSGKDGEVYLSKVDYTPIYVLDNGYSAENRYELIDMKNIATSYANGNKDLIDKNTYNKLINALKKLEKITK